MIQSMADAKPAQREKAVSALNVWVWSRPRLRLRPSQCLGNVKAVALNAWVLGKVKAKLSLLSVWVRPWQYPHSICVRRPLNKLS